MQCGHRAERAAAARRRAAATRHHRHMAGLSLASIVSVNPIRGFWITDAKRLMAERKCSQMNSVGQVSVCSAHPYNNSANLLRVLVRSHVIAARTTLSLKRIRCLRCHLPQYYKHTATYLGISVLNHNLLSTTLHIGTYLPIFGREMRASLLWPLATS